MDQEIMAREAARILLETRSVLFNADEPFIFTSGETSPVYIDVRRLISFPDERSQLMDYAAALLMETIGADDIDYVAGGETAGIPYAAFVAERLHKPMLYVRKKPKGFGKMAQIEGCMEEEGKKVVLIEDLQTDGGSKRVFIEALRNAGAIVENSFVVFHYDIFPKSQQNMQELGVALKNLVTWWDVLAMAKEMGSFDNKTLEIVESFLNAPEEWRAANPPKQKTSS